mgnify:CR=1 FL=1
MKDKIEQIAELLAQTGEAHHAAFYAEDGAAPDWPLWYAEYLQQRLPSLRGEELTTSEPSTMATRVKPPLVTQQFYPCKIKGRKSR